MLLRRFCARHAGTARILWGECDGLFTLSPLGPLVDIAEVTGGELADLVADGAPPHAVAAAVLRDLAGRLPAIVVFEDVHWADDATLDVLRLLSRRLSTVPALLVASYRDDELDRGHPLRVALGELSRREATDRLRLVPLSMEAVAELAAPHGVDAVELHRRTAGNPFFVTEALAAGGVELPATVRDAVLARVAPLSPPARRLLDAAAIVPGTVELPLLEALAGDDTRHLEECLSCGVLGAAGAAVAFRHDLARVAVEETLAPDRRLALHRRALAALAGADPARLAYHAEGAADADAVLRFAPAPPSTPRRPAPTARPPRSTRAPCASATSSSPRRAPRCSSAARTSATSPTCRARRSTICGTRSTATAGSATAAARATRCARCRASSGVPAEVDDGRYAPGRDAVAVLEPLGPGRELAMAYANLASLAMNHEDAGETAEPGAHGRSSSHAALDAEAIEIHALNSIGTIEFLTGGPHARATAERSLELALEAGLVDDTLRAYANLTWAALRHRAYPLADRYLRAATSTRAIPGSTCGGSTCSAIAPARSSTRAAGTTPPRPPMLVIRGRRASTLPVMLALAVSGRLRARRGDPDPWTPLDEALALAGPELQRIEPVAVARAEAAWLSGDDDRVIAETDRIAALAGARRPLGDRRDRRLAAPRRRRRRSRRRRRRAVRARAGRRLRAGRRVLDGARLPVRGGARARRLGRRGGAAAGARRAPGPRRHGGRRRGGARAAPARRRQPAARRGRRRARTRRSSRRASSRCSPWSPTACATATSPSACSCRPRRSSTTSRRSAPSSARARAARPARRRCGWACCA